MRLIDADELIKKIEEEVLNIEKNPTFISACMHSALLWVIALINRATTIEAEPVSRGEWVSLEADIGLFACSNCGHKILRTECNYCPNCGAKMDKKSPENHKKYQEEETNKKSFK